MDVNFLTNNPAVDEFNRANDVAQKQETQGLQNQKTAFDLKTAQTEAPTRLRMLGAQADTATAQAQKATAEAPYAGPQAAATLQQTRAQIGEMNARTATIHMDAFTKELVLLDQGDVEGAKRLASSVGDTIPDTIIQNSQARAAIKNITTTAQQLYPGRPKDQMTYITAHLTELGNKTQQGQPVNPQTAPYQPAPGAPVPQETSAVQGAGGETERIIAALRQEDPKLTYADAVGIAKRAPNGDTIALRKETLALNAAKADPAFNNDPNATLAQWRQKYGLTPMAGAPGAPPPAPQRPPSIPAGSAYSPSRNQWRDPQGNLYGADGSPVAAAAAPAPNPMPSPPISQ